MKMRNLLRCLVACAMLCSCGHKVISEKTILYSDSDSVYVDYGYCKEVYRVYDYVPKDSTRVFDKFVTIKGNRYEVFHYLSEYGDTIRTVWIDLDILSEQFREEARKEVEEWEKKYKDNPFKGGNGDWIPARDIKDADTIVNGFSYNHI